MLDRLVNAVLGGVFGALLGVLLWWLYGMGFSARMVSHAHPGIAPWVMYIAGTCAVLGLLLKSAVADVIGDIVSGIYKSETQPDPWWLILLLLGIAVIVVWYFSTR